MKINLNTDSSYIRWREEYKDVLKSLPGKQIYILFSGGKDSSMAMELILRAAKEFRFDFEAHAAAFPVHRYTDEEKDKIGSYWSKRDKNIIWHETKETDEYIDNTANPCLLCQGLRKKMLKNILTSSTQDWNNLVLIAGYSLWDIVSYSIEHLISNIFSTPDNHTDLEKNKRFLETAQRFYPLMKMKEGYTIFRPLIKFNNDEIQKVVSEKDIPTLSIPCKFQEFRPKKIMEKYFDKMGTGFNYDQVFDFAKKSLGLPGMSSYTSINREEYLRNFF